MAKKDLFDDTTMTFGEHLDELRRCLWRAIIGLLVCVIFALFFGGELIAILRGPVDRALADIGVQGPPPEQTAGFKFSALWDWITGAEPEDEPEPEPEKPELDQNQLRVKIPVSELEKAGLQLQKKPEGEEPRVELILEANEFAQLKRAVKEIDKPKTFAVQEAFMSYLKVSLMFGLVLSAPWIFYQVWRFVAAGLYPNERKYVYLYLPISLGLFIGGALFCFYAVFPFVLEFLLAFNQKLGVQPQIRLSEWISFAIVLPLMFGISFQLPMVMLFLERIGIFEAEGYRKNRRIAILVIAIASMMLTPGEPASMVAMMVPLVILYEFGIWMCGLRPNVKDEFADEEA